MNCGYRECGDRRRVVAERPVELVVVILGFAEIVDDVAEMVEEGGAALFGRCGRGVERHLIGDAELAGIFPGVDAP